MTRKEIKAEARGFLKGQWGKMTGMFIVYALISYAAVILFMLVGILTGSKAESLQESPLYLGSTMVAYVFQCMLMLGYTTIMLKVASGRSWGIKDLFSNARYTLKVFGMLLLMTVYVCLWSCLFIIPGIVKAISYSMALYILAEDPTKGINQCITESKEMMKGNKRRLLGLVFSFFGWILLGVIGVYVLLFVAALGPTALGDLGGVIAMMGIWSVIVIVMLVLEIVLMIYIETSRAVFYYEISGANNSYNSNDNLTMDQIKNQVELGDDWSNDFQ